MNRIIKIPSVIVATLLLFYGGILIVNHTTDRLSQNTREEDSRISSEKKLLHTQSSSEIQSTPLAGQNLSVENKYDEWCEARDYKDLSEDEVFKQFDSWISGYEKLKCFNEFNYSDHQSGFHDPRKLSQFVTLGEKLSRQRRVVFEKIIRGDPSKALALALPENAVKHLPDRILSNIEKWHNVKVDLHSIHVCYDTRHPEGLIKRFAVLDNGQKVRVWTFGNRTKIKTIEGLSAWGVSMGNDFAMSDKPYREVKKSDGRSVLTFAGEEYPYVNEFEKNLFIEEIS